MRPPHECMKACYTEAIRPDGTVEIVEGMMARRCRKCDAWMMPDDNWLWRCLICGREEVAAPRMKERPTSDA